MEKGRLTTKEISQELCDGARRSTRDLPRKTPKQPEGLRESDEVVRTIEERFFDTWMIHRNTWSKFLLGAMTFSLLCQPVLIVLVGLGMLDFTHYTFFLNSVACELFAQITLMCAVVVKALFPKNPKISLASKSEKNLSDIPGNATCHSRSEILGCWVPRKRQTIIYLTEP